MCQEHKFEAFCTPFWEVKVQNCSETSPTFADGKQTTFRALSTSFIHATSMNEHLPKVMMRMGDGSLPWIAIHTTCKQLTSMKTSVSGHSLPWSREPSRSHGNAPASEFSNEMAEVVLLLQHCRIRRRRMRRRWRGRREQGRGGGVLLQRGLQGQLSDPSGHRRRASLSSSLTSSYRLEDEGE